MTQPASEKNVCTTQSNSRSNGRLHGSTPGCCGKPSYCVHATGEPMPGPEVSILPAGHGPRSAADLGSEFSAGQVVVSVLHAVRCGAYALELNQILTTQFFSRAANKCRNQRPGLMQAHRNLEYGVA